MHWLAQAPANIALIKYMGKKDELSNLPDNASLSYTLNNLLSTVYLEPLSGQKDLWEPLVTPGGADFNLSLTAQQRFINHLARLKNHFNYAGCFLIKSTNNFPQGSGLASSASSFAALTRCASLALSEITATAMPSVDDQAQLSRQGSGSSCRSFYSPWALWEGNEVKAIDLPYQQLLHQVILVSHQEKTVSSSDAHRRVKTSTRYAERSVRAQQRLDQLLQALKNQHWAQARDLCWHEFQDMHQLFSTCEEPFSYLTPDCLSLLTVLQREWELKGDGPIVTMDAGPNIHLLYRLDQSDLAAQFKQDHLVGQYDVL